MHRPRKPLTRARFLLSLAGMALLLLLCLVLGTLFGAGGNAAGVDPVILYKVRLPRVLLAAVLGSALASAGVVFQAFLRNPLADPYVLGVSGGASLGGVAALIFGLGGTQIGVARLGVPFFAFLGALGALVLIERIATVDGRFTVYTLLLTGAIFNAFSSALIYFIQSIASLEELQAIVFYLMGSVPSIGYGSVGLLAAASLLATVALAALAKDYNALSLGEEGASQIGVDVERLKRRTFLLGSLLTALAVSVAGLIGFVGLIIPHLLRLVLGPDHRLLLPACFLGGGAFLVAADLAARMVIAPNEIPIGVVTALVGGPFFLFLLRSRGGGNGAF